MMSGSSRFVSIAPFLSLVLFAAVVLGFMARAESASPARAQAPTITVTPQTPNFDVNDPTNLQEAAYFAWQEFIALTWPAPAQGPTNFPRGVPLTDGSVPYGKPGPTGQVVFETFRHKVEVFPGGVGNNPNGYVNNGTDYGFSSIPNYQYDPAHTGFPTTAIPPAPGMSNPAVPPFDNLDEVTQITLNAMYAGIVSPNPNMGGNSQTNQLDKILFQAKVNEAQYDYVAANKYWGQDVVPCQNPSNPAPTDPCLAQRLVSSGGFVQTGDAKTYPGPYINLPSSDPANKKLGTIEIKTAWRRLGPKEDASKFYTARVRYYVGTVSNGQPKITGFVDSDQAGETWGLVALHIIQKTPNAPSFIYATFGQINNIVDPQGNPVEDPDGTTKSAYVNTPPFIPNLNIVPPPATVGTFQTETITGSAVVNTNSPQLYYHNVAGKEVTTNADGTLYTGPVNVNRRLFMIPQTIISANQIAHNAISAVNSNAVWLNYRLINVQARPIDIDSLQTVDQPTFYLANEVVETNPSLQRFSGGLQVTTGKIFDYSKFLAPQPAGKDYNTFVVKDPNKPVINKYLMGGCMGCHGSQGQKAGGDFSVIFQAGRVPVPDIVQEDETQAAIMQFKSVRYGKPLVASGKKSKR